MADNTFNFDLDAPAVPTLTLDPAPAAEEKAAPVQQEAPAPEAQVNLTPEEQAMVDQFAEKIDITNSQQVLQYGSACQKKIGDFSEAALSKVSTKDLGEVGDMITSLIGELKSFDAGEEEKKGILGFFKKKGDQLDAMKMKYNKAETNVEKIQSMLEGHQVQLLKLALESGEPVGAAELEVTGGLEGWSEFRLLPRLTRGLTTETTIQTAATISPRDTTVPTMRRGPQPPPP